MGVVWLRWLFFRAMISANTVRKSLEVAYWCITAFCVVILATGCTDVPTSSSESSPDPAITADAELVPFTGTKSSSVPSSRQAKKSTLLPATLNETNVDNISLLEHEALSNEVRERMLEAIATDLSQPKESISLETVAAQTWPNGCLGLAAADEFCTMAIVEGWQIEASDGSNILIYRSNESATNVRRATN